MAQRNRIRLALVSQAAGGIYTHLKEILSNIDRHRFDIEMVISEGDLVQLANESRIKYHICDITRNISLAKDLNALWKLRRIFKLGHFDIIHLHSGKAGVLGRLAALFVRKSKLFYTPNAFPHLSCQGSIGRSFFLAIERILSSVTDCLIVVSPSEKERALLEVKYKEHKVRLITNSIDVSSPICSSRKKFSGIDVLMVARPSYQKNCGMFLRVAKLVLSQMPRTKFVLAGAGQYSPEKSVIEDQIRDLGLESSLSIIEWLDQSKISQLQNSARVIVSTSRYEGLPYSLLEAMKMKKPIVATDVEGNRDVVVDGVNGYLVKLEDDNSMARKIVTLLQNYNTGRRMGSRGFSFLKDHFSSRRNVKNLENAYLAMATDVM